MQIKRVTKRYTKDVSVYAPAGSVEKVIGAPAEFCCEEMAEAWKEKFISFGEYDGILNKDGNVNIYHCSPYPEGACWGELAIKFCPFCGEEIEIVDEA